MINKSIKNQRLFCPNATCVFHGLGDGIALNSTQPRNLGRKAAKFHEHGSYFCKGRNQSKKRFRCQNCKKTFSQTIGSIEYRVHRSGLYRPIFLAFVEGLCNRQIARMLGLSESVVRYRLRKLAQQSLLQHQRRSQRIGAIREVISYDGLENFAKSQYEPNNINQAIGMESLFIYDFNFSPLNRKGRMSDRQKLKKDELKRRLGEFRKDAIRLSTTEIIRRLAARCEPSHPLCLATDEHYLYRRSVNQDLRPQGIKLYHQTISAKAPRVYKHILFPVNHTDLLVRQHVKAFARETISFSKHHAAMTQKYALFMAWKNYFRPQFTKKQQTNPKSNIQTPAMALNIEFKPLRFRDFFGMRLLPSQIELPKEWSQYYDSEVPNFRIKAS